MSSVENSSNDPQLQFGDSAEHKSESGNAGSTADSSPKSSKEIEINDEIDQPQKKEKEVMFKDSSHSFFVYFGEDRNKSGLILSIVVLMLQTTLYSVMLYNLGDKSNVLKVEVPFGKDCSKIELSDKTGEWMLSNLVCPPIINQWQYGGLASVLLSFFMMHDIFASIKVMVVSDSCIGKMAGFVILMEAVIALGVASGFALQTSSYYEAVSSCIGILFVHDTDEKAFQAYQALNLNGRLSGKCWNCCCCCSKTSICSLFCYIFWVFLMVVTAGSIFEERNIDNIIIEYGQEYWNAKFGDDFYSYLDDSTVDFSFSSQYY